LDSLRFYYIARGSLNETINHVITAHDLGYVDDQRYQELYDLGREAERALNGFTAYIWRQRQGQTHYGERLITEESAVYHALPPSDLAYTAADQTNPSPS
jgi:hypothetical protein